MFRIDKIDTSTFNKVFKKTLWPTIIAIFAVLIVQIIGIWIYFHTKLPEPIIFLFIVTMFCVVFMCVGINELLKKCKPSNWLFAISDAMIYIKFRSSLYDHLAKNDNAIIAIKPSEIEAFRQTSIVDVIAGGRTEKRIKNIYLEIIIHDNLLPLKAALANEHRNYGLDKPRKTKIEVSWLDFPVTIPQENIIRINIVSIRPAANHLVAELKNRGIKELEASNLIFNFTTVNLRRQIPDDVAKQRIVELLKEGRRLDARNAIEYFYLISRKETNEMIEELIKEHVLN